MKKIYLIITCALALALAVGPVWATDLNKAKNTVNQIKPADPPKVSTTTKPSPVGQKASEYHPPAAKSMKSVDTIKVPPPAPAKPATTKK
jgi:hypothetical protein